MAYWLISSFKRGKIMNYNQTFNKTTNLLMGSKILLKKAFLSKIKIDLTLTENITRNIVILYSYFYYKIIYLKIFFK